MKIKNLYPAQKQRRSFDCGITCALNVLQHYSFKVSRKDFKQSLKNKEIKKYGASIQDLVEIFEKYDLKAQGILCDKIFLMEHVNFPAILLLELAGKNHYVIAYQIEDDFIYVADPSILTPRIAKLPIDKFIRIYGWQGILIWINKDTKEIN